MVAILRAVSTGGGGSGGGSLPDVISYQGVVTSVPMNAVATVVSRIVPPGYSMKFTGVIGTGTATAEWYLYDDSTELYRSRTSGEHRALEFTHNPISIPAGHTLALKVVHQESGSQNFEGTLLGYDA